MNNQFKLFLVFVLSLLMFGVASAAYDVVVNINGVVQDASGPISGASVWITYGDPNTDPNACVVVGPVESSMTATTNSSGQYSMPALEVIHNGWCYVNIHSSYNGKTYDGIVNVSRTNSGTVDRDVPINPNLKVILVDKDGNALGDVGSVTVGSTTKRTTNGVAYFDVSSTPASITFTPDSLGQYNNKTVSANWNVDEEVHTETITITRHASLKVDSEILSKTSANLEESFSVTASIRNTNTLMAPAVDTNASISFSPTNCARLASGETSTKSIGTINGGTGHSVSWNLVANSPNSNCRINIDVRGIDNDSKHLANDEGNSKGIDITDDYTVYINAPTSATKGSSTTIRATVTDVHGNGVSGATVTATLPDGTTTSLVHTTGGTYQKTINIGYNAPNTWALTVSASKDGNSGSASKNIPLSAVSLSVSMNSLNAHYYRGDTVTVSATVKYPDGTSVTSGNVHFNGRDGSTVSMSYSGGKWIGSYTIKDTDNAGSWTVTVNADDGNGNTGSASRTTTVLNQYNVTITSPIDGTNYTKGQNITVTAEVKDTDGNMISGATVIANGPSAGNTFNLIETATPGVYSAVYHTSNANPSGAWTITVNAQKNGNSGSDSVTVNLESPASLALRISIVPNTIVQNQHATVNVSIANPGEADALDVKLSTLEIRENDCNGNDVTNLFSFSAINQPVDIPAGTDKTISFDIWSNSAPTGNYTLCVVANGTDENSGDTVTSSGNATFVLDVDGPFYSNEYVTPISGVEYDASASYVFYINWTDESGISEVVFTLNGTKYTLSNGDITQNGNEYSIVFNALDVGNYTYNWVATDGVGNSNSTGNLQYGIIKKSPYDPNNPNTSLIHLSINGNESNFTGIYGTQTNATGWKDTSIPDGDLYLFLDGAPVNNPDIKTLDVGTYEYKLVFNNSKNYADAEITRTITLNKAQPVLNLTINGTDGDTTAESYSNVEINLTSTLDGYAEVYSNGTLIANGTIPLTTTQTFPVGTYIIKAVLPGTNNYDSANVSHTLTVVDTQPPIITLTSPAGGSLTGPSVFLNATTNENATCRFGTTSNPTTNMSITGSTNHSEYLTGLADGNHTYYVNCTDSYGHSAEVNVTWTVDATAPNVAITNPSNGASTSEHSIKITWNGNDANGIDHYELEVDGVLVYTGTATSYTESFADGSHTVNLKAYDTFGNVGNDSVTFSVYTPYTGGGGGGGPLPTSTKITVTVDKKEVVMTSDDMAIVNVNVTNEGGQYAAGLEMFLRGIPSGNYKFSDGNFDLDVGDSKIVQLKIAPVNLLSGDYKITVKAANDFSGDSDTFTLKFTNLKQINATSVCDDASKFIEKLMSNGTDTANLKNNYDTAMSQINAGDFDGAIKTCEGILSFNPSVPTTPTTPTTPSGVTGFFIAAGKFTMSNLVWILVVSAIAIALFLMRGKILGFFKKPPTPPAEAQKEETVSPTDDSGDDEPKIYTLIW